MKTSIYDDVYTCFYGVVRNLRFLNRVYLFCKCNIYKIFEFDPFSNKKDQKFYFVFVLNLKIKRKDLLKGHLLIHHQYLYSHILYMIYCIASSILARYLWTTLKKACFKGYIIYVIFPISPFPWYNLSYEDH